MQRVTLVRYTTKPEHAAENEALSRAVFAQLRGASPNDVAYALLRDGNDFIHVFLNLKADEGDIADRCEVTPQVTRLAANLVDCFGFTSDPARP
jgi:hypothetical protein